MIDAYTTDGRLLVYDLVVLEDDLGFFPPYEAAPLVRGDTLARYPQVGAVLGLLGQAIDERRMRSVNLRLQEQHEAIEVVAYDLLRELDLLPAGAETVSPDRAPPTSGLIAYMWSRRRELARYTTEHMALSAVALTLGILLAVPLALALDRFRTGTSETLIGTSLGLEAQNGCNHGEDLQIRVSGCCKHVFRAGVRGVRRPWPVVALARR